jgi:hypothetical protein
MHPSSDRSSHCRTGTARTCPPSTTTRRSSSCSRRPRTLQSTGTAQAPPPPSATGTTEFSALGTWRRTSCHSDCHSDNCRHRESHIRFRRCTSTHRDYMWSIHRTLAHLIPARSRRSRNPCTGRRDFHTRSGGRRGTRSIRCTACRRRSSWSSSSTERVRCRTCLLGNLPCIDTDSDRHRIQQSSTCSHPVRRTRMPCNRGIPSIRSCRRTCQD